MEISPPNEKINSRTGIQVIARAAAILRTLQNNPEGLSLAEIAKSLDLPRSTVQRIVEALDVENLVIAASRIRGVRLGPALLALAASARFEISEVAKETMYLMAGECHETVALSIHNNNSVVFIDQVRGGYELRVESPVGKSLPMHSTAPGKAMLAAMDRKGLTKIRSRLILEELTSNSITDWDDLMVEIEEVKQRGVAFDREETSLGISAIAVALKLPNGDLAAISIPVPTQRFTSIERKKLETMLKKHSASLQKILSGERHQYPEKAY